MHSQSLKKLLHSRVNLWISSDLEAPTICNRIGVNCQDLEIAYVFKQASSYIMLSKEMSPALLKSWKKSNLISNKQIFYMKQLRIEE